MRIVASGIRARDCIWEASEQENQFNMPSLKSSDLSGEESPLDLATISERIDQFARDMRISFQVYDEKRMAMIKAQNERFDQLKVAADELASRIKSSVAGTISNVEEGNDSTRRPQQQDRADDYGYRRASPFEIRSKEVLYSMHDSQEPIKEQKEEEKAGQCSKTMHRSGLPDQEDERDDRWPEYDFEAMNATRRGSRYHDQQAAQRVFMPRIDLPVFDGRKANDCAMGGGGGYRHPEFTDMGDHRQEREYTDQHNQRIYMPRVGMPTFDGNKASSWLERCKLYFEVNQTPENYKTRLASLSFTGDAEKWYECYREENPNPPWPVLVDAVFERFKLRIHLNPVVQFKKVYQEDYSMEFKMSKSRLLSETEHLSDGELDVGERKEGNDAASGVAGSDCHSEEELVRKEKGVTEDEVTTCALSGKSGNKNIQCKIREVLEECQSCQEMQLQKPLEHNVKTFILTEDRIKEVKQGQLFHTCMKAGTGKVPEEPVNNEIDDFVLNEAHVKNIEMNNQDSFPEWVQNYKFYHLYQTQEIYKIEFRALIVAVVAKTEMRIEGQVSSAKKIHHTPLNCLIKINPVLYLMLLGASLCNDMRNHDSCLELVQNRWNCFKFYQTCEIYKDRLKEEAGLDMRSQQIRRISGLVKSASSKWSIHGLRAFTHQIDCLSEERSSRIAQNHSKFVILEVENCFKGGGMQQLEFYLGLVVGTIEEDGRKRDQTVTELSAQTTAAGSQRIKVATEMLVEGYNDKRARVEVTGEGVGWRNREHRKG